MSFSNMKTLKSVVTALTALGCNAAPVIAVGVPQGLHPCVPVTTTDEVATLIHRTVSMGEYQLNLCFSADETCVSTAYFARVKVQQPSLCIDHVMY